MQFYLVPRSFVECSDIFGLIRSKLRAILAAPNTRDRKTENHDVPGQVRREYTV
jgi:hypothetical protein